MIQEQHCSTMFITNECPAKAGHYKQGPKRAPLKRGTTNKGRSVPR